MHPRLHHFPFTSLIEPHLLKRDNGQGKLTLASFSSTHCQLRQFMLFTHDLGSHLALWAPYCLISPSFSQCPWAGLFFTGGLADFCQHAAGSALNGFSFPPDMETPEERSRGSKNWQLCFRNWWRYAYGMRRRWLMPMWHKVGECWHTYGTRNTP